MCKIIKTQARTKNIPVIMFTALGRDVDRKLSAWAGADSHFTKPFVKEELLSEIKKCLAEARCLKFSICKASPALGGSSAIRCPMIPADST